MFAGVQSLPLSFWILIEMLIHVIIPLAFQLSIHKTSFLLLKKKPNQSLVSMKIDKSINKIGPFHRIPKHFIESYETCDTYIRFHTCLVYHMWFPLVIVSVTMLYLEPVSIPQWQKQTEKKFAGRVRDGTISFGYRLCGILPLKIGVWDHYWHYHPTTRATFIMHCIIWTDANCGKSGIENFSLY